MHLLFRGVSVVPVMTIERKAAAVPLAEALDEGRLRRAASAVRQGHSRKCGPLPRPQGAWPRLSRALRKWRHPPDASRRRIIDRHPAKASGGAGRRYRDRRGKP
jgi:hypothetical protein